MSMFLRPLPLFFSFRNGGRADRTGLGARLLMGLPRRGFENFPGAKSWGGLCRQLSPPPASASTEIGFNEEFAKLTSIFSRSDQEIRAQRDKIEGKVIGG